jgi:tungstate transport system substrate-binding protein
MYRRGFLLAGAALAGCTTLGADGPSENGDGGELTVGTTSSTYDTGVLDELHLAFEESRGVRVGTIAAGTGELLRLGERGDVDVVMAHAPSLEDEFLEAGYGINRRDFLFGDFVLVGPPDDPAGIDDEEVAAEAFKRIAEAEATFLSRGDSSGTHVNELEVWEETDAELGGEWYLESGQNMGNTLSQADQQDAYLLSVRGNFIEMREDLDLELYVEGPVTGGDPLLDNPYGVFAINPARHPHVEYEEGMAYIGFLTGHEGQGIIEDYTVDGERLFYPDGLSDDPNVDQHLPDQDDREREYETGEDAG